MAIYYAAYFAVFLYCLVKLRLFLRMFFSNVRSIAVSSQILYLPCRKKVLDEVPEYEGKPDKKPTFSFPLRNRYIQEGSGFKLLASIDARPPPNVSVYTDSILVFDFHDRKTSLKEISLRVIS